MPASTPAPKPKRTRNRGNPLASGIARGGGGAAVVVFFWNDLLPWNMGLFWPEAASSWPRLGPEAAVGITVLVVAVAHHWFGQPAAAGTSSVTSVTTTTDEDDEKKPPHPHSSHRTPPAH